MFVHTCFAGVVSDAFARSVEGASSVRIVSLKKKIAADLLVTADAAKIAEIASLFDLVDPVTHRLADGREVVMGPCFCISEYVIEFVHPDAHILRLYVKDDFWAVVPDDVDFSSLAVEVPTDLRLTDAARVRARAFIAALESP